MTPDVTIITCIYNKGSRTKRTMESILGQTYPNWRYIVIDDGSTDNTKEILAAFSDPRIEIRYQHNRGFCATMVRVMADVETPFVALQGAGDESAACRLELQKEFLSSNVNVGAVGCGVEVHEDGGRCVRADTVAKTTVYSCPQQLYGRHKFSHGEVMMRIDAYAQAGGYREFFTNAQDRDLWLRLLQRWPMARLSARLYRQVVNASADLSGSPARTLKQAQLSSFAVYVSQQGIDVPNLQGNDELATLFGTFVSGSSLSMRWKWARRVGGTVRQFNAAHDSYQARLSEALVIARQLAPKSWCMFDLCVRKELSQHSKVALSAYERLMTILIKARRLLLRN